MAAKLEDPVGFEGLAFIVAMPRHDERRDSSGNGTIGPVTDAGELRLERLPIVMETRRPNWALVDEWLAVRAPNRIQLVLFGILNRTLGPCLQI
jgi:hypothetical protein